MSADKTGKWWVGHQPDDIREFLEAYASDGYKVDEFRLAKCVCGSERFFLWADDDEGCARKQCESCKLSSFLCDSEEYWDGAKPAQWKCTVCKSKAKSCNIGSASHSMRTAKSGRSISVSAALSAESWGVSLNGRLPMRLHANCLSKFD